MSYLGDIVPEAKRVGGQVSVSLILIVCQIYVELHPHPPNIPK